MKSSIKLSIIVRITIFFFLLAVPDILKAQVSDSLENKLENNKQDYLGWGISFANGSTREQRTGLMYSTLFHHKFSQQWSGEVSFNLAQRDYQVTSLDVTSNRTFAQTIILSDISLFYRIGRIGDGELVVGAGPSVQYQNSFLSAYPPVILLGRQRTIQDIYFVQLIDHYTLGANTKVDYWLPLHQTNAEIGFRLQAQAFVYNFASTFQGSLPSVYPMLPTPFIRDWLVGLGIFLRFGV